MEVREMKQEITEEYLQSLEGLCEKATPGPWKMWGMAVCSPHLTDCPHGGKASDSRDIVARTYYTDEHGHPRTFDGNLICASRTALPLLIAEVERLRAELGLDINGVDGEIAKIETEVGL